MTLFINQDNTIVLLFKFILKGSFALCAKANNYTYFTQLQISTFMFHNLARFYE